MGAGTAAQGSDRGRDRVVEGRRPGTDRGRLREIEAKVYAGERLDRSDALTLYDCDELSRLGRLALHRRTRASGDRVTFVNNRNLSLTNICSASCTYCSFHRKAGEKGAYILQVEEAVERAQRLAAGGATELQIVNGLHPTMPWRYYPQVLSEIRAALPDIRLRAFSATEIHWYEKTADRSAGAILDELIDAGLDSLTAAGADIFDRDVRRQMVDHATDRDEWWRIHRLAHGKGMRTPASMLYGHIEAPRHRVDHLLDLRDMQDETGGFTSFIPVRYRHDEVGTDDGQVRNRLQGRTTMVAPAEALRMFALSRLVLDNVEHVNAAWGSHGQAVAALALQFGADDLDAAVEYKDGHVEDRDGRETADGDAGTAPQTGHPCPALSEDDLLDLVWQADLRPVERDTLYRVVHEYDPPVPLARRRAEPQQVWA